MKVRTATLADATGMATVHIMAERTAYLGILPDIVLDSLSQDNQETAWRQRINNGLTTTFVAEEDDNICGLINISRSRDSDATPSVAEIRLICVNPHSWRCGVGTALWERAKSCLQSSDWSEVTLWVLEANHLARKFYEKIGFTLDTDIYKTIEYGPHKVRAVRYRLALTTETT
jgi:ribosomal protein S18 acetylase RimI-like enzyme